MKFEFERYDTVEEVRAHIKACKDKHMQQVAYSAYSDTITQICYTCRVIRTSLYINYDCLEKKEKKK